MKVSLGIIGNELLTDWKSEFEGEGARLFGLKVFSPDYSFILGI